MKTRFVAPFLLPWLLVSCGGGQTAGTKKDAGTDPGAVDTVTDAAAEESVTPSDPGFEAADGRDLATPDLPETDVAPQQGQPGWPCNDNAECLSGWCIETPAGKECAATCLSGESCPSGFECVQVATVPDVQYACVHPAPRVCRPCASASDCESGFSTKPMNCEPDEGRYWCVEACEGDDCFPEGGCACTALGEGMAGKCERSNAAGTCAGDWTCQDGAPTACTAAEAQPETCNGADDDCDGVADDGLSGGECEIKNAYGSCKGVHACVAGTELCQGSEPKPEVCNGIDENCDGKTDEGFSDMDLDGVADCVDPDRDGDGVPNDTDNCPDLANSDQVDTDGDKAGDACDTDDDNDGVLDPFDNCPLVKNADQKDTDGNGVGDACDGDRDGDGIPNEQDNCPDAANAGQEDLDEDGLGDACDGDVDGDGVLNTADNCVTVPNPGQEDLDKDGLGDACDPDRDGDTVANDVDNCPDLWNSDQADLDKDGLGDACDPDRDGDGVLNEEDNCPGTFNPDQADTNVDGVGDACENDWDGDGVPNLDDDCPWVPNPGQEDLDLDAVGDACDCDIDGDGVANANPQCPEPLPADNCPKVSNPDQADLDSDGLGDACDPDVDGDGDPDATDCAPRDPAISHNAVEACNGVDDDCDGLTDEEDAVGCRPFWRDEDLDAFGGGLPKCLCAVAGFFTAETGGDCNDTDPAVNPGVTETCGNGRDDNCNGSENEEDAIGCLRFHPDLDSDGYGTGDGKCLCAAIWDYSAKSKGDCDDLDPAVSPGLPEKCDDGKDNDCDGQTDEEGCQGCTVFYRDDDGDGYGLDGDKKCLGQAAVPYTATKAGDCADHDAALHPGADEACNGLDDNCDGTTDPMGSAGCQFLYPDVDKDGFGANVPSTCLCAPVAPYTATVSGDCLDTDPAVNPAAKEVCGNGRDDDCSGTENDENATGCVTFYTDADGDGYGVGAGRCLCTAVGTLAAKLAGDCADNDPLVNPGAAEKCNDGKDNDCDGQTDEEGCQGCTGYYRDADQDKYGVAADKKCLGTAAYPYIALAPGDCDDGDANAHPGALELCNGKDDNCDGQVDPSGTTGCQFFYPDVDKDGYGANLAAVCYCKATGNYTATVAGDCNDSDATMNPASQETCDGKDNNCNGQVDEGVTKTYFKDVDKDGWGLAGDSQALCAPAAPYTATASGDCDDADAARFPTNPEVCDTKDNNCNGQVDEGVTTTWYKDNDGDGYGGTSFVQACTKPAGYAADSGDCNDYNKDIHPNAMEACNDIDDDCDGNVDEGLPKVAIYRDLDGDGFGAADAQAVQDCLVGGSQAPAGYSLNHTDCDDTDSTKYPGHVEECDGKDNNCDAVVDPQCPSVCPGAWPVSMSIGSHMPARLLDYNHDGMDEVWIVNGSGKLQSIATNGAVTAVCPSLTFATGYGNKFGWTVNPSLGAWKYYFVQGTRLYDLDSCVEVKASADDVAAFGSVGDLDGDTVMDYVGHWEIGTRTCFKLSSKGFVTSCLDSPSGKPWDGYVSMADTDGDGKVEGVTVRGRTYPGDTYYDGSIDVFGYDGAKMVLEKTIAPSVTGWVGVHLSGLDLPDWLGDGYSKRTLAFNGKVVDLGAGSVIGTYSGGTIPNTRLADVDGDGDLDGVRDGILLDTDGNGVPESLDASGTDVTLVDNKTGKVLPGWPLSLGTLTWSVKAVAGDADNDGRVEVFVPSIDGALYCYRLGVGSYQFTNLFEPGEPTWVNRSMVKDPFEPNGSVATAHPLTFPTKEIRGYLTKGDVDYYRLPGVGGLFLQLHSPPGLDYDLYWYGTDESKVFAQVTGTGTLDQVARCVGCTETPPAFYTVKIVPKNPAKDFSASRPYVLKVNKVP